MAVQGRFISKLTTKILFISQSSLDFGIVALILISEQIRKWRLGG